MVNDTAVRIALEPRELLGHVLRERIGCRGVHLSCSQGVCGACTVLVDGAAIRSCLMFAIQAAGCDVRTIAAVSRTKDGRDLEDAMRESGAVQCGFCTAGIVLSTLSNLAEQSTPPERVAIADGLAGHVCRCTGYSSIIDAIERFVGDRRMGIERRSEL
ncbi:2Fe-2S iron-sulfur cluster-binding protein [Mycolicibacterium boenickei]